MEQRGNSLVIGVPGAGWSLVARIATNGRGIASIDVVVDGAATSSSFHVAETDLPTHSLNGPPVYGIHDRDNAFPMDGGRVLRGLLAPRMGMVRATQVAATLGKVLAIAFIVLSFFNFSIMLMLIGFFVYVGAEAEAGHVIAKSVLGEVTVADLMQPPGEALPATATAQDAAALMVRQRQMAVPVTLPDGRWGVVTLDALAEIPLERRDLVLAWAVARPAPAVPRATNVWDAMRLMSEEGTPAVPVVVLATPLRETPLVTPPAPGGRARRRLSPRPPPWPRA